MGVLLIKKPVIENWMKVTKKNFLWIAREYGNVSPSYISQIINNNTNIPGNFVGFIIDQTKLSFDDLFYYDGSIQKRNFYGKVKFINGEMLKSAEYRQVINDIIEQNRISITA